VRVVSSLAAWLSVVPPRWTTTPTSSHCALGRAVGKRLYAYTLVQTYPSHTTASTCLTLAATRKWSRPAWGITACIQGRSTLKSATARSFGLHTQTRSMAALHLYEARPRRSTEKPKRSHHSTRPSPSVHNGVSGVAPPNRAVTFACLYYYISHTHVLSALAPVIGVARR
jgi:hypothetical protein